VRGELRKVIGLEKGATGAPLEGPRKSTGVRIRHGEMFRKRVGGRKLSNSKTKWTG